MAVGNLLISQGVVTLLGRMAEGSVAEMDKAGVHPSPLTKTAVEPNFLLEWPQERSRSGWAAIIGTSLAIHAIFFWITVQLPSFIPRTQPEKTVIVRHIPLYLPPSLLTQKAPNRARVSQRIDLAGLRAQRAGRAGRPAPRPSMRRFEVPKPKMPVQTAKNAPASMPQAPQITANQPAIPPPGAASGLPSPVAPPPKPSQSPFQDIGGPPQPNTHPTLAPPRGVQAAIDQLAHNPNSRQLVITQDNRSIPNPGATGSEGTSEQTKVELQSDPKGSDLRPYLTRILAIVRANWRRVTPESARMGTLRGRAVIEFIISRDGNIPKLVMADSSGSEPLDRAAVAGLSMSNPLPPLPDDYKGLDLRLAFTFSYNMPAQ